MDTLTRIFSDYEAAGDPSATASAEEFRSLGLPTQRDENWRYVNVRALDHVPAYAPAPGAVPDNLAQLLPPPLPGFERLVLVNGRYSAAHSTADVVRTGFTGISKSHAAARFDLLNRMFAPEAQGFELADGKRLEVLSIATPAGAVGSAYPRLNIRIAPRAQVELIERYLGTAGPQSLVCSSVDLELGDDATLDHYRLQQCAEELLFLDTLNVRIGSRANWRVRTAAYGASTARTTALVRYTGADASLDWHAVAIAHKGQIQDLLLEVEHAAPRARTNQVFRAIATEGGHAACSSEMIVVANTPGANTSQSLRGLLEGKAAEIDLRPRLVIHNDNVQAKHGATTGQLDDTLMFYLLSRGIEPDVARTLLRWAFLGDVLRAWAIPELRRTAERAAAGQLQGGVPEALL
jgi:Fe-S cluster assembly protein SufD